jgi:predicted RNase H-like nuclease (RuvC/YqgF family)
MDKGSEINDKILEKYQEDRFVSKQMFENTIRDLNKQLYEAYKRIAQLTKETNKLKSGR